jgi:putative ABC transport system ATP-binding protein
VSALPIILSAQGIHHCYGSGDTAFVALKGIDLDVYRGEVLILMGPSGSGKTTLVQIMGCLLRPTQGQVWLGDRVISDLDEEDRNRMRRENFGFIFQTNNLFSTLSVTENVMVALDLLGVGREEARARARDLLVRVGLGRRLDAFPTQLSGGQKQRVGIARALASDPQIMLADEPTAALDATSGHQVMEMLRQMAHENERAVVIVTHDNRILDLADRIVRLEDGALVSARVPPDHGRTSVSLTEGHT